MKVGRERDFDPLPPLTASVEFIFRNAPDLIVPPLFPFAIVFHDNQLIVPGFGIILSRFIFPFLVCHENRFPIIDILII